MPETLQLYNTMSRRLEPFQPLEPGRVRIYTCGPTVYNHAHIGNLRTFLFEDVLRRTLALFGYQVTHVMNLTDVDDKTIRGAAREGLPLDEYTAATSRRSSPTSTRCASSAPTTTRAPPTTCRR